MDEERKRIGKDIGLLRKKAGLSIHKLSAICRIDAGNISKIENGKVNVTIDIINRLLEPIGGIIKIDTKK